MGWLKDFGKGFKKGYNSVLKPASKIPFVGKVYAPLVMHKGGKVHKTQPYLLEKNETVFTKGQMTRLKKAKTNKTRNKIINDGQKRRAKKPKSKKR
jgi:hypothetical protein